MSDDTLKDVIEWIASKISLTIDTDLFAGGFPDKSQANASCVKDNPGSHINFEGTGNKDREDYGIKVLSRGEDYFEARSKAYEIYDILKSGYGIQIPPDDPDKIILVVNVLGSPAELGQRDNKGRWIFSANYELKMADI